MFAIEPLRDGLGKVLLVDDVVPIERGRIYFLTDVSELLPGVLEQLLAIHEGRFDRRATIREVDHWAARWRLIPVDPVSDNWPRAVALATLEHWREHPEFLEQTNIERLGLRWHFPSHGVPFALTPTEEKAQRSARSGKRGRERYHELVRQRGYEPAPILRERTVYEGLECTAELIGLKRDARRVFSDSG